MMLDIHYYILHREGEGGRRKDHTHHYESRDSKGINGFMEKEGRRKKEERESHLLRGEGEARIYWEGSDSSPNRLALHI